MSQQNRTALKHYFRTGRRPTQEQFADLIDSGLNLTDDGIFEDGGNLTISGDVTADGNLTLADNKYVKTDKVRARDSSGLRLYEDGGKGLYIQNGSGDVTADGNLTVSGNIEADHLVLNGDTDITPHTGPHTGPMISSHEVNVPTGRVVVGLKFKKYRNASNARDYYTFALKFK